MSNKENFIPVNEPVLCGNEKKYLSECIDSGWISSEGPFVSKFEKLFAQRVGRKYGVAVSSGTAALDIAIEALGLMPGDEVIVPAFIIISCVNQIVRVGARPVLVDADPITWSINANLIEEKITSKTKAILVAHIYGLSIDMDKVIEISKNYGIPVIEDAAEAHGLSYKGKECGSFGEVSIFSFYSNKLITTGEGGMLLTDDYELSERYRSLRNLCFESSNRFVHERLGWNYRMTNLQAAIGLAQLERINEFISLKRLMGKKYNQAFKGLTGVQLPPESAYGSENIYWVYGLLITDPKKGGAKEVMSLLLEKSIGTRPFFCPINKQPFFQNRNMFLSDSYPISENLYENGFYIPSGAGITDYQIERVAKEVWEIFG
jgi:perosamine synthetase